MLDNFSKRRYLLNFDTQRLGQVFTDVLVIGSGVAGLRAAIEAGEQTNVVVACKDRVTECNTTYAQGGIAVVTDANDSVDAHVADTLQVGCGLGFADSVRVMAQDGPACLQELRAWGAKFDEEGGEVARGMEGGHSARRVIHAMGDATGRELERVLIARAKAGERVRVFDDCFVLDLVVEEGRCIAALTHHDKYGYQIIWAKQVILASGGGGCLFRETTNPPSATADGAAIAFRAGAVLRDMEFFQFHPTALYIAGAARALISEAVRGEGARLVDKDGYRFMPDYHPDSELAPRDAVSRAILHHIAKIGATCAYLDVRYFAPGRFDARFPGIAALCREFEIDPSRDLIPVRPAAHYMIGGVAVDIAGRSSIPGLFACGEASSSGVHGANRLASNSLLEGLVFGKRVGALAGAEANATPGPTVPRRLSHSIAPSPRTELDLPDVRNSLRALCWRNTGIDRVGARLAETLEIVNFWDRYVMDKVLNDRLGWETQNMLTVARCMAQAAMAREESRGVHFRSDFPARNDQKFLGHILIRRTAEGIHQEFTRSDQRSASI
jgi:L-aspartate oxidase